MTASSNHRNRLPLYFTGTVTVIFLLVGTVLLFQILNLQSNHVDMQQKQDILLQNLQANQKEILKNQQIFTNLSDLISFQISDNRRMTTINMKNINETQDLIEEQEKTLKDIRDFLNRFK